jgi:hypothetical protein
MNSGLGALFNTLHSQKYAGIGSRPGTPRESFFLYCMLASAIWCAYLYTDLSVTPSLFSLLISGGFCRFPHVFFLIHFALHPPSFIERVSHPLDLVPGYLFKALSYFTWVCWIAPKNVPINQLFG